MIHTRRVPLVNPLYLLPLLFLGLFFFYPLAVVLREVFAPGGVLDLPGSGSVAASRTLPRALWFTSWQAALRLC